MMKRPRDSAPGPDGIPYSGWSRAGEEGGRALYNLCEHILDVGECHPEFNYGHHIFLAKGDDEHDTSLCMRAPS
eukprot:7072863-Pyramimonas_sp.AAC.1